ncbi:MAG: vWA domain-containing protein [Acutalibacteraceae bacterium]
MKRVNCFILTLILLFGFAVSVAAEGESIRITYAGANLPEIVVNAQTDNMDIDCQDVTLNFDGKTVNASSAEKYDKSKHSRRVFFLLDLSTSMKVQYFTSAKECIADFADNMGENTTVYLITFGKDVLLRFRRLKRCRRDKICAVDAVKQSGWHQVFCSYKTGNGYIGYLSHGRYGICRGFFGR